MKKFLLVLTISFALIISLAACKNNESLNESGSSDESTASDNAEETPNEESTTGDIDYSEETSGDESTTDDYKSPLETSILSDDEVESIMNEADNVMSSVTSYTQNISTTMSIDMADDSYSMTQTTNVTLCQDGEKIRITTSDGITMTMIDGICYMYNESDMSKIKYSVTQEDIAQILDEYGVFDSFGGDDDSTMPEDVTIVGKLASDGTVTLSFENISSYILEGAMGELTDPELEIDIKKCDFNFIISSDRKMTGLALDLVVDYYYSGEFIETLTMTCNGSYEYGNVSVDLPADADEYVDYEEYFAPDGEESELLGLPLDGDNYEISYDDQALYEEQYLHIWSYSEYYEGKTFILRGSAFYESDEVYGDWYYTDCGFADSYSVYTLVFEDGVTVPEDGEEVILTATLVNIYDEDGYLYDFCMLVNNIEKIN